MEHYYLIIFFIILVNAYFLSRIFLNKFKNMNGAESLALSIIITISIISVTFIPFYIINSLQNYFVYVLLSVQAIALIFYALNFKICFALTYFNYAKILNFILCMTVCILVFVFVFYKNHFINLTNTDKVVTIKDFDKYLNFLSFFNLAIFNIFLFFNIYLDSFYNWFNYAMPFIMMIILSLMVSNNFAIKKERWLKNLILNILITLSTSFLIFNIDNNKSYSIFDSYAYTLCVISFIQIFKEKKEYEIENFSFSINSIIFSLVLTNLTYIGFVIILLCSYIFYLFYKKINFGLNYVLKIILYFLFTLSIWFLGFYKTSDIKTITYSISMAAVNSCLLSIFLVYKKNEIEKGKYHFNIQKITKNVQNNYFYYFMFIFTIIFIVSIFTSLSKINEKPNLWFIKDIINFNVSNNKEIVNTLLYVFYFGNFTISLIAFLVNFKKIRNLNNDINYLYYIVLMFFNPLIPIVIEYQTTVLKTILNFNMVNYYFLEVIIFLSYCFIKIDNFKFNKDDFRKKGSLNLTIKSYAMIYYKNFLLNNITSISCFIFASSYVLCSVLIQ